ncbi:hypothetical protein ASPZODRAFT_26514 [Penicilliopsis zonata CBS 506.65]|uniref:Peptide N-acetyl-beta-D-glucosaminyl asparaginase amidase A N-terminal domain-containing protein n=1 Tax=Penicilliopsis zonata CBS 506.65 TaxID=1073090 RepID=A0A1L9SFP2_9EURO|nr:hypothetical protein ASPZODRAFT_26514 [Penicilliopsis zonata CBS 506.65]OJJ45917.1 hypothetical protein ASPZODRAFT_26514 [Penicilliopsis zonata CBS 506.65]
MLYTYAIPSSIAETVLSAKTTHATVSFHPIEIYMTGTLERPDEEHDAWRVSVSNVPNPLAHPNENAVLHLTQGELGKPLGSVELGAARSAEWLIILPVFSLLHDFQVHPPTLIPAVGNGSNPYGCVVTQTLMAYDFANSYGVPFVGEYTPPSCSFNRVVINFTLDTKGVQYDRLAVMYFNSTEIWRTSTAEPTTDGIIYSYAKEMQQYLALWKQPQKIIFDLANIVDSTYTGILNTTLTATFFTIPDEEGSAVVADEILPISMLHGGDDASSMAELPSDTLQVAYTLPRNMKRAVISISACGQADEEFWYTNVFSTDVDTFADETGDLYGYGPWREVQVWIDGFLAGVSWPFPVIFTGGIVPGFWRPIVGIDAFDLREHEIDITPFIPYLSDGKAHTFQMIAAGVNNNNVTASVSNVTNDSWYVTGKIFVFLDEAGSVTTGTMPTISAPDPTFRIARSVLTNSTGANETLVESISATRSLFISSTIKTSAGEEDVSWSQELQYVNHDVLPDYGWQQVTFQNTIGVDKTGPGIGYVNGYEYPINCTYGYAETTDSLTIWGELRRTLVFNVSGPAVFPNGLQPIQLARLANQSIPAGSLDLDTESTGSILSTTQTGTAYYYDSTDGGESFGSTNQTMTFEAVGDKTGELYQRTVGAVNSSVVFDDVVFKLGSVV